MNTRTFILTLSIFTLGIFTSCSDDSDSVPAKIPATAKGTWTDARDGHEYRWVRYGNTDWMADNFQYKTALSRIYISYVDDEVNPESERNLAKYGRLYSYSDALAACPEGWRLPTDEDWQQLEQYLGMSKADAQATDWRGDIARNMTSVKGDECDLNLLLGGYYTTHTIMSTPEYRFMGVFAFYWTSTQDTSKEGKYYFYRKLTYARNSVYRQSMEPEAQFLNVRYVRDAE